MKPEDLTPEQMASMQAIGFILLTILIGSAGSWVFFFQQKGPNWFSVAKAPTATFGFVDCLTTIGLVFLSVVLSQTVWSLANSTGGDQSTQSNAVESPPTIEDADEGGMSVKELPMDAERKNDKGLAEDSDTTNSKPAGKAWGKLTPERIAAGGWASAAQLIAILFATAFIVTRTGCHGKSFGWHPSRSMSDIAIGMMILMMSMPILLLASGLINSMSGVRYEHPVIDAMKEHSQLIAVLAWQAVIVAPVVEEFFFRAILIGWFESIHFGKSSDAFLMGWSPQLPANPTESSVENSRDYSPPWWPSLLSATLFGLVHFSYGISWIPLIVFGIVLGRVFQCRQSLVACIAIHMAFNGINLLNLWLSLGLPQPGSNP